MLEGQAGSEAGSRIAMCLEVVGRVRRGHPALTTGPWAEWKVMWRKLEEELPAADTHHFHGEGSPWEGKTNERVGDGKWHEGDWKVGDRTES